MAELEAECLRNLEENVHDPVLREKLRPDYRAGCKRLIFSPDFYDAIQHGAAVDTPAKASEEPDAAGSA